MKIEGSLQAAIEELAAGSFALLIIDEGNLTESQLGSETGAFITRQQTIISCCIKKKALILNIGFHYDGQPACLKSVQAQSIIIDIRKYKANLFESPVAPYKEDIYFENTGQLKASLEQVKTGVEGAIAKKDIGFSMKGFYDPYGLERYGFSFGKFLKQCEIKILVVMGFNVNACVKATIGIGGSLYDVAKKRENSGFRKSRGALQRGYRVLTAEGINRTADRIANEIDYESWEKEKVELYTNV